MGYDLHIIRSDDWTSAAEVPIDYAEWIAYAESDARLSQEGTLDLKGAEPSEQPLYAFANGPSIHWWRGHLVVSGADDAAALSLRPIAEALRARVQGDDGEFYD